MSLFDDINEIGVRASLPIVAESVSIQPLTGAMRSVAAIVDRQPRMMEMLDEGYMDKEPIVVEILKGTASSTETIDIDGGQVALDFRGLTPKQRGDAQIDGAARRIVDIKNCGTSWQITTIKNV